ncbi:MAG: uncharacterized protein K0R52_428 [Alphaproteobacteria bacterium]|jgi:hypothetical protein|nr:uncharacterized protein [Alphaproteobacteria bacterium]
MKNIIIFKNRDFSFYDFNKIKTKHKLRLSIVTFKNSFSDLSEDNKNSLDNIYLLDDNLHSLFDSPLPEEKLYGIIKKEIQFIQDTWIVAADELNILTAASLRKKFNLTGSPSSIILNYRNKAQQKKVLSQAGIRIPKFIPIKRSYENENIELLYIQLKQYLKEPFILKPVEMGGSTGVERIETYDGFIEYFKKFKNFSSLIAEELINGQLYHCDFIIQGGNYVFSEVSEYIHNGLSFLKGYNHGSLLLIPCNPLRLPIIEFCKKANSVLGLKSGCAHFEVFVTNKKEIIFLEAAARPAGSLVPLVFTKTFKTNYMNAALLAEIDEDPGIFNSPNEYYFWTVFPKKPGIVKKLKYLHLQSPYDLKWLVNVGNILDKPLSVSDKSGFLVANNKNYEVLKSDFYFLRKFDAIEIEKI